MGWRPDGAGRPGGAQSETNRAAERLIGDGSLRARRPRRRGCDVTRFRRSFVWFLVSLLVLMLVATLVLDGLA